MIAFGVHARPRSHDDANVARVPYSRVQRLCCCCDASDSGKAAVRHIQVGTHEAPQIREFACTTGTEPPLLTKSGGWFASLKSRIFLADAGRVLASAFVCLQPAYTCGEG